MSITSLIDEIQNSNISSNSKRSFITTILQIGKNGINDKTSFDNFANKNNWKDGTYNTKLRLIKALNTEYKVFKELAEIKLKKRVKVNSHEGLSPEEYNLLVNYSSKNPSRYSKAILLLLNTGVRFSELDQIWNLSEDIRYFKITEPKTDKQRLLYIKKLPDAFYKSVYSCPCRKGINLFLKKAFDFKKTITVHSLRASFITYMYYSGMKIEQLALIMGKVDSSGNPVFSSLMPYLKLRQELAVNEVKDIFDGEHLDLDSSMKLKEKVKEYKNIILKQNRIIHAHNEKMQKAILRPELQKLHSDLMEYEFKPWIKANKS